MKRKGMMVGKGKKGYHNVISKDPMVHSQSARGIKQPQRLPTKMFGIAPTNMLSTSELKSRIKSLKGWGVRASIESIQEYENELKKRDKKNISEDIKNKLASGEFNMFNKLTPENELIQNTVKNLDDFEDMTYNQYIKQGMTPEKALEILVNTVEGDTSQLSSALKKYADKKGLMNVKNKISESDLSGFIGSESYHKWSILFPNFKLTDGANYLAEKTQSYWFMDVIGSYQGSSKFKKEEFQVWSLKKTKDNEAVVIADDGNNNKLVTQKIPYTDFFDKFEGNETKVYFTNGVILLPSEY